MSSPRYWLAGTLPLLSSGTWPSPGPPRHPDHQKPPLFLLRPRHRAALQLDARGVQEPLHPIPASPPRRLPYLIPPICQLDTARHPPTSLHLRCKSVSRRDTASAAPFLFLPLPLSLSCMLPLSSTHGLDQNGSNEELSLSPCEARSCSLHVRAGDPTGFIILPSTDSTNPPETHPRACSCRARGLGFTRSGSRATAPPLPAPSGLELQPRSWCCNTTSLHPPLDPAATRAIPTPLLVPPAPLSLPIYIYPCSTLPCRTDQSCGTRAGCSRASRRTNSCSARPRRLRNHHLCQPLAAGSRRARDQQNTARLNCTHTCAWIYPRTGPTERGTSAP